MNRKQIQEEIKKLDPKLGKEDEAFFVAEILLSALKVGADTKKVAEFLEVNPSDIEKYAKRFAENDIWEDGKTKCDWFDKEHGGISFWMDVTCGLGYVKKVSGGEDE